MKINITAKRIKISKKILYWNWKSLSTYCCDCEQKMFRILNVLTVIKSSRTWISPNFRYYASKDVYKSANYNAPYENEDLNLILKTLNESKSTEEINKYMAKNTATKIFKHMSQHGPFEKVENLLDVVGILPENLEKICNKVIKTEAPKDEKDGKKEKKIPLYQQKKFTKLKPGIRHLKDKTVNSIVGIKFSLEGLAFAHIGKEYALKNMSSSL